MTDGKSITDRAADLANQAAAAAGPLKDKAADLAGQAGAAAAPIAKQAKERATTLAGQAAAAAGPITEQARVKAAHGIDVVAGNLDKLTRGKYSDQIHSVASKVEDVIDGRKGEPIATVTDPTLRAETVPLVDEPAPLNPEAAATEAPSSTDETA